MIDDPGLVTLTAQACCLALQELFTAVCLGRLLWALFRREQWIAHSMRRMERICGHPGAIDRQLAEAWYPAHVGYLCAWLFVAILGLAAQLL
jgi:hypothetical protein